MLRTAALRASRRVQAVALQQQRAFAEKAVAAEIDWDAIGELVHSDEGKREITSLRSTYSDIKARLEGMAKEPAPINWAKWRKEVDPALVDGFKSAFDSMKLPEFESADLTNDSAAKFAALIKEAEALVAVSETRTKEIQKELASIAAEKARIATTTVDDELAADPALAEEVDKEVAEKYFMP